MEKNVLFLATVPSMIVAFNTRNIKILQEMGYSVHAACNFKDRSAWTDDQVSEMMDKLTKMQVTMHQVDVPRKPWHPILLLKAYAQIKRLAKENTFYMMHNQSCVSGIIGRIALRKKIPIIMHTEHGFYYFKGGPLLNWVFYPFDKLCSKWTDELVVINRDDYKFSNEKLKAKHVTYIPGVGIDTEYYYKTIIDRKSKRKEFGIPEDAFVVLSVGELNENKNHAVIINALSKIEDSNIYYVICGEGIEKERLVKLSQGLGLEGRVILNGMRHDVNEFIKMSDIFAFPSKREGLGLAALEAMAGGLPLICSNKNGINDYAKDGVTGYMYDPEDVDGFAEGIKCLKESSELRAKFGEINTKKAQEFGEEAVDNIMRSCYARLL